MTRCAMCSATSEVDHGLLCKACRAEDRAFSDDVSPVDPSRQVDGDDEGKGQ